MAVFKCKMCGGDLEISEEIKVTECEYCGTKQTVPNSDNEKKINLFNRANRLRMASEFDKAAGIYENIIAEFPEEAESYWGLCLCNYGIEYVDDPLTAKKIPTCHRASFESIQKDENFELALEYADVVAQKVYRDEAREIDRIMQDILSVSKNEKPYDVFICYKETDEKGDRTIDSVLAYDIYEALTAKGFNVFFSRVTLEDKLGRQYEPYIFAALNSAKVMLSIGTKYEYFHAVWVKNEWSRFLKLMAKDKSKVLIPCFKDIDAYDMPEEFKALQAQDLGKLGAVQDIVRGVEKIISDKEPAQVKETVVVNQSGGPNVDALLKRGNNALEDGDWNKAKEFFDQVLNMNAECAEAYLGLAMADNCVSTARELILNMKDSDKNYLRAKQYADKELLDTLAPIEAEKERIRILKEKETKRLQSIRENLNRFSGIIAAGDFHTVGLKSDGTVVAIGRNDYGQCDVSGWTDIVAVSAGGAHTVGLKSDGTVVATKYTGDYYDGQCDVSGWTDIIAISVGGAYTVGLKSDGTVVATGHNGFYQCNVGGWKDIIAIVADAHHTVGLKSDGTVVARGRDKEDQCNVSDWKDIIAIAAGYEYTVGLKSDGTVVATGFNKYGQCNVAEWTDIIAICAEDRYTVGLKSDGTVVATGDNDDGQCDVSDWTDIVAVSVSGSYTVGLKSDGTVVATGFNDDGRCDVSGWTDIVAVSAGGAHTVGLKSDGTVVATGYNKDGQCDVSGWKLFDDFDNLEEERKQKMEAKRIAEEQRLAEVKRIKDQKTNYRQRGLCQHCGGTFKGLFTKKCSNCGKEKDY